MGNYDYFVSITLQIEDHFLKVIYMYIDAYYVMHIELVEYLEKEEIRPSNSCRHFRQARISHARGPWHIISAGSLPQCSLNTQIYNKDSIYFVLLLLHLLKFEIF